MAAKKILFQVEIEGSTAIIKTQKELADAVKATNEELKKTEFATQDYEKLEKTLAQLKATQKDVADRQRIVQNEFEVSASNGTKTYRAMNAELGNLRALYRELTELERNSPIGEEMRKQISGLDKELKDIDASIGNFQRNVGDYEGAFAKGFEPIKGMLANSVPGFAQLNQATDLFKSGIEGIGQSATKMGKMITAAFIGFQIATLVLEGVKAIQEFTAETNKLRGEIGKLSKEGEEAVRKSTIGVMAVVETFGADQEEVLQAASVLSKNFGISMSEALGKIESGFLAGANANGKWLDTLIEMSPKAVGAGASLDQFTVALAQSGKAGLQEEEMIEGVVKRSKEFTGTLEQMIDRTDQLTQKQIAQLAADRELAEAKVHLSENINQLTGTSGTFFTQLQTVGIKSLELLVYSFRGLKLMVSDVADGFSYLAEKIGLVPKAVPVVVDARSVLEAERDDRQGAYDPVANKALLIAQQIAAKQREEEAKKRGEEARQRRAERRKLEQEANAAEAAYYTERIGLLNELSSRVAQAGIDAIQDQTAKEIAAEQSRYAQVGTELLQLSREQEAAQLEARIKLVEAFGPNSARVKEFDERALADVAARREQAAAIERQELENHLRALEAIKADAQRREATQRLAQIQASIAATAEGYAIQANADAIGLEQAINKVLQSKLGAGEKNQIILSLRLKAEQNSIQQEVLQIDEQIAKVKAALQVLAEDDTLTSASIEEYNTLNAQLDSYSLKRAQLEKAHTETVIAEEAKRRATRDKEIQGGLQNAQQVIQIFDTFAKAISANEIAQVTEREQASNDRIAGIEKKLQGATGTQKIELEKQLANEKKQGEQIAKEKAKLQKEEAQRAKAFAVIQSIIATALAVSRALATPPAPNVFAAALAGGLGVAQTALIAAQPAATGGVMGVQQQGGGLVVMAQNIPQMKNGDNVLATLRRGEVVLNKRQQAMLGGAPTFRAMNVPGFAEGGAAGGIISAPDLSGITSAERLKQLEANQDLLIGYTKATNNRIDRIKTYVVSEDVQSDLLEGESLKTLATLE